MKYQVISIILIEMRTLDNPRVGGVGGRLGNIHVLLLKVNIGGSCLQNSLAVRSDSKFSLTL